MASTLFTPPINPIRVFPDGTIGHSPGTGRGPLMPPIFTDPSRLPPDVGLESAMGGRLAPVKSGLVKNLKGGLMPGKRPVRTAAPGQPGTPGTPTPTTPPPGGPVGAPGSPEWYASQPSTFWHGTGPLPAGADPATYNPAMAAATANNPALAAYARSGLEATSPIFNRPGAQPGAPAGTPGATPVPIGVNPPPPSFGPMANPPPAPSNRPGVAPPPPVTTVGYARPAAASNRPTVSPITTTVVVPAAPAPSAAPATRPAAVTTTYSSAAAPAASKTPAAPTYKPKTATFADGGRASKRRRRKPEMAFSRPLPMDGQDMRPMPLDRGTVFDPWAASRAAARFQSAGLEPLNPALEAYRNSGRSALDPVFNNQRQSGMGRIIEGEVVGRDDARFLDKPGATGMTPVPDANQGQPFDPWARSRAMSRPMTDFGLESLTRMQAPGMMARRAPFTNGYADGGRVKRAPVTIENGYADGGKVGELLTYQDYRNLVNSVESVDDNNTNLRITPQQWAAMSREQRWETIGGRLPILPGDPRYDALKPRVGGEQGRAIWISGTAPPANGIVSGAPVERSTDGSYIFSEDSRTPEWQAQDEGDDMFPIFLAAAALMVGGAAAMGAFSSGATVGTQMGAAAGQGFGTATGVAGATGAAGAAAGTAGGIGLAAEGAAGVGTVSGAGTVGGTIGTAAGITGGAGAIDVAALAANPAVQGAASTAGQSVGQWLSNPANLQTAMRIAGTVGSLIAGGNSPGGQVQPIPAGTGTPIPGGTGTGVTVPGAVVQPGGGASGYTEEALDPAFLASLDPANFEGGPADLSNWQETRGRFRPLEDMLFDDAMKAGSAAEQEAAAGTAGADVEQTFKQALDQQRDRMVTQGVNPDAGVGPGLEIARLATLDKAKAAAGAKNIARRGEKDRGEAARARAATIGGQISGQALNADNIGLQYDMGNRRMALDAAGRRADLGFRAHEGAAGRSFQGSERAADREFQSGESGANRTWQSGERAADRELRRLGLNAQIEAGNYNRGRQDAQDTGRGIGQAIGTGLDIYRGGREMGWWGSNSGSVSDAFRDYGGESAGNWGDIFGYAKGGRVDASKVGLDSAMPKKKKRRDYRDGARVEGAGTGTSDSIRARLSDGEGVLNAEAMELLDSDNPGMLDELNDQGLKIRAVRKALKRGMSDFGLGG